MAIFSGNIIEAYYANSENNTVEVIYKQGEKAINHYLKVDYKNQDFKDLIEELEEQNKELSRAILLNLAYLAAGSIVVVSLLKLIDDLSQECAEEGGVTLEDQLAINEDLLDLAEEQEEDGNPIINTINGFTLSVETDDKNPVGTLKRRFAVGKDSKGITVLKGEPSFSANEQILIDELVFYIQQNDLKAT